MTNLTKTLEPKLADFVIAASHLELWSWELTQTGNGFHGFHGFHIVKRHFQARGFLSDLINIYVEIVQVSYIVRVE